MMEEIVPTKCWNAIDAAKRLVEGDHDGQQLCVSLRSHVVQARTERCGQGTTQGCRFRGSRYESTGLGDVCERSPSFEGVGKTDATFFPRDPWGGAMWMRSCAACKALLHKLRLCDSVRCQCGWIWQTDWKLNADGSLADRKE